MNIGIVNYVHMRMSLLQEYVECVKRQEDNKKISKRSL
jgi:hypothetical protein